MLNVPAYYVYEGFEDESGNITWRKIGKCFSKIEAEEQAKGKLHLYNGHLADGKIEETNAEIYSSYQEYKDDHSF